MTKEIRNRLIAKLQILITQQGVDKEALYGSFGVTSSKQMSDAELVECVSLLEEKAPQAPQSPYSVKAKTVEVEIRRLRSEILSLITKSPNAKAIKSRGLGVPNDWAILNPFIAHLAGKRLNELSVDEMDHFKGQLYKMRDKDWVWSDRFKERLYEAPKESTNEPIIENSDYFWKNGATRCRPQIDLYLNTSRLPS